MWRVLQTAAEREAGPSERKNLFASQFFSVCGYYSYGPVNPEHLIPMPPNNKKSDPMLHHVSPDQLRIGMYVYIDLPWFLHPFTLNSFRISSEEQIAGLRALDVERFRYDPERSDGPPAKPLSATTTTLAPPDAGAPEQNATPGDPAVAEKERQARHLREHRRAVAQTEKAFIKAAGIVRKLSRNILPRRNEVMEELDGLVHQMASVFLERADVSLHVMGEKCGGEEAYLHGLNVSILSMMLVKGLNLGSEQAHLLGTGALLHDIGQSEIPDRVLKKNPEEHTRAERELYANHVEYGVSIGKQLELAPEALSIIAQHHELADGSGYPHGLRLEQIAPLARVVSLVNYYDNLCNPVLFSQAMTPHEALSLIFARRKDKFDAQVLQLLIRQLGVYPPGTIVKLSNDLIGMVISVNPQKALRPWILLYHEGVPKHEAIMLDLDRTEGVSISRSLRPAQLPPAVYSYLSPRRRITYFFDSDAPASEEQA
jgi:putative nucleotidyltransferase with HDIG domain